ncbi:flagellar export chaperone FliS [Bremerella sp. T1]|uniref:flagellar export chaperone FliS n=1 Tax=Bremerella sp. TYQ1 TaxID=3119568 RepID=UPI001CCF3845|nr:flagellar export chaperone FliS [Bremerella volcania]UBM35252.1 flagellar protein FliS [Bremerella volcania]
MSFQSDSTENYLETEVLTATPQKLQLMMINGAIRFAYQAQHLRKQEEKEEAWESLLRCREIVAQILCSIKDDGSDLMRSVAGVYFFLFQELTELHAQDEYHRLEGVLNVLNEERETWEELCRQMPEAPERPREEEREITSSDAEEMMGSLDQASETQEQRSPTAFGYDPHSDYYPNSGGGISFDA